MRQVVVSPRAATQLDELSPKERRRVVTALHALAQDPFRPRPGADIKKLEGTEPPKYRLRVGDLRAVFAVDEAKVYVLELFKRNRGYRLG
jgi:mRNA interferase RelE/StbE